MSEQSSERISERAEHRPPGPPARWSLLWLALALVPIIIFALMAWQRRWMSDDGFINLRVVQNLLAGHGPVYNIGERVEAYTSTLWLGFLALFSAPGIRPERVAVYGGALLSLVGAFGATWAAAGLHRLNLSTQILNRRVGAGRFIGLLPLGMLTYAVLPPAWDYATSGLETGMSLAWLGLSFAALVWLTEREAPTSVLPSGMRADQANSEVESIEGSPEPSISAGPVRDRVFYAVACFLGLAPLIRPELQLFCLGFAIPLLLLFFGKPRGGFSIARLVKICVALGALPIAYQIFRMGYFAALVPNTAYAKGAFESRWEQGARFFENFFFRYWLLLPIVLLGGWWVSGLRQAVSRVERLWTLELEPGAQVARVRFLLFLLPAICGVLYCIYVVKIGGGFMHGRLFLPGVFGLLLPVMAVPILPFFHRRALQSDASTASVDASKSTTGNKDESTEIAKTPSSARRAGAAVLSVFIIGWAAYCGLAIRVPVDNDHGIGDERGWYARQAKVYHPVLLKDYEQMHFYTLAEGVRANAMLACPQIFEQGVDFFSDLSASRELGAGWEPPQGCRPIVDARVLKSTDYDELYPSARVFDIAGDYVERGIVLVTMQTAMGIQGLVLGPHAHLVDHVGLTSPIASRLELKRRGRPGHEKALPSTWMIGRFSQPNTPEDPRVHAARRALECGDLKVLMDATNAPMNAARFMKNLGAAWRLNTLSIPADPIEAMQRFCGLPTPTIHTTEATGGHEVRWHCPEGYALSGIRVRQAEREEVIVQLRPECREITNLDELEAQNSPPAKKDSTQIKLAGQPAQAPAFGEHNTSQPVSLDCHDGTAVIGFRGKAGRVIEEVAAICSGELNNDAFPRMPPLGEATPDATPFEVRCPEGSVAVGFAGRAGALVDAVGVICGEVGG